MKFLALPFLLLATAAVPTRDHPTHPPIKHVFVLILENESVDVTFGPESPAPYLADTLVHAGAFLPNYYGIGHSSLDNYIALVSGQAPNVETQDDCITFTDFQLKQPKLNRDGQAIGVGCVYPKIVPTLMQELDAKHLTWKGYMEDLGGDPKKERATCGHPQIGARDRTQRREPNDQYATKHNPFYYFHSVIDDSAACANIVNLHQLTADLQSVATTPNYAFITPNLCNDGHDPVCVTGVKGGLTRADQFLRHWVPIILSSPAFKQDGMLIVTFDESGLNVHHDAQNRVYYTEDSSACCNEKGLPGNPRSPGGEPADTTPPEPNPAFDGPGGGRTGAVILSPFVKPATVTQTAYNHYSTLRLVEDLFGLPRLGYAAARGLPAFGSDVFVKP